MTLFIFFCVFALAVLAVLYLGVHGQQRECPSLDALPRITKPVDLEAFSNLTNPLEEAYLCANLPGKVYLEVRRERLFAVLEYLGRARLNAAILLRLGEAAESSADKAISEAGQRLVAVALQLRLYTIIAPCKVYASLLFDGVSLSLLPFERRYVALRSSFETLSRLQTPAQVARLTGAI